MQETSGFGLTDTIDSSIVKLIYVGSGGTADCFRVNRHGKWMLMKRLKPEYASNERYRLALLKEYEIGIRIDHPNIVRYQYIADSTEEPYILQDYIDGLTLDKFIKQNPDYFHKPFHRRRFLNELLSAVACLHAHQVVHLDLNPSNIIITTQGQSVKLIDLGMAFNDAFISTYGGTKGYQAPEMTSPNGEKPTLSADIYSIGCIMKFIGCRNKSVIRRCLSNNAQSRYQTVNELQQALKPQIRRWAWFLAAVILMVAIIIISISSWHKDNVGIYSTSQSTEAASTHGKSSVSDETATSHKKRTERNKRIATTSNQYNAAMSEIRNSLNKEKQRIYSVIDEKLAKPNLNERNLYDKCRNILIVNCRELRAIEKNLYEEKGFPKVLTSYADSVNRVYFARIEKINQQLQEENDTQEAAGKAKQQQLYDHIVSIIDKAYKPILQMIASPPTDKRKFYKRFIELKDKANSTYAAALQQGYKRYGVTLSEKQMQQLTEKISGIEEMFYTKYNEK